jgi:fatty-acyl-CoA synthase
MEHAQPHSPRSAPRSDASALIDVGRRFVASVHVGQLLRARASLPGARERPFLLWEGRTFTYADVYREAQRYAALFRRTRLALHLRGELDQRSPLVVGVYRDNAPSFVFAVLGAALDGAVVIALNTGFRGDTLAALLDKAEVRLLIAGEEQRAQIEPLFGTVRALRRENLLVDSPAAEGLRTLERALVGADEGAARATDANEALLVLYTSGTTGVPKGIACSHIKLIGAGAVTWSRIHLRPSDRGYVCMPLFHSNAWFLGIMPLLLVGGSFVLKKKFSASAFEGDMLEHGVTYMNYVGQPLHYILDALEKKYGSPEAVEAALAHHPKNHFRIAHGNGATASDREKLVRYLGMRHVYELYGSTEAVINSVVKPGDPIDSVGRVSSPRLQILDERGTQCPPATVDENGRITNYDAAVGEICSRTALASLLFDGYYGDPKATQSKFRDGYYHSGDLGHVRVIDGKRYLYFDGRTEDWIRKDGENFSAESVAQFARREPGVAIAVAYGVPAPVSDELVAVALQLREGATFDPDGFHARLLERQRTGGMDPKWMPDFVRVEGVLPTTSTDKVLVRQLKREGFDLARRPEMVLYFRQRGDATYRRFTRAHYDAFVATFAPGRARLVEGA